MTDPLTLLVGGLVAFVLLVLVGLNRLVRLRRHIADTADAVTAQRARRDAVIVRSGEGPGLDQPAREQLQEVEDRIDALEGLYVAQVRAWNRLGEGGPWQLPRLLARWRPMALPTAGDRRAAPTSATDRTT